MENSNRSVEDREIRSFNDKIDWKIIDQLHSATSTFSSASIELKKMFFILISISSPIIIKLSDNKLDYSLFITIYLLIFTFWYLDSFTFYYQEGLREKMDLRFKSLTRRNISVTNTNNTGDEYTLENNRTSHGRTKRVLKHKSLRIYPVFIVLNTLALLSFFFDLIS